MIDSHTFSEALMKATSSFSRGEGIGRLGEKLIHKVLKLSLEPCEQYHEVKFLGSVADIKNGQGIVEIQTRALEKLLPKLRKFLPESPVTVVYPIVSEKRLFWFDKESGELSEPRKSPKKLKPSDALPELSKLSAYITHERLTVKIIFLAADEYKSLDGWDKTKKRGATKIECIPTKILDERELKEREDYKALIPDSLGDSFTAKDFNKATALRGRRAYFALKFLLTLGLLEREQGKNRAYVYKRI